jgi:hypothetical protein
MLQICLECFNPQLSFNQPITLDCSSCTTLREFLLGATNFDSSLNLTNTSKVTTMRSMFFGATLFNKPVNLDCSSCTSFQSLLVNTTNFNSPLNLTNTSRVTSMVNMFGGASSFNQPITLDCSSCTILSRFLDNASQFNSSLNLINTSKVTNMSFMFLGATAFNKPISLDCSSCTTLSEFLNGATNFNNTLNLTPIPNLADASGMLVNTSLSTAKYSNLLTLWGSQPSLKSNVPLTATGIKYYTYAQPYRDVLTSSKNWNIVDGGEDSTSNTTVIDVSSNIIKTYGDLPFQYTYSSNNPSTPTYSSSYTNVATIDASGVVTILSAGTTTLIISQAATSNYTDGSANTILTVQANNASNPAVITNGIGLEYFLTTNAIYGMINENIAINENIVNQGNTSKIISSNGFYQIFKE